ncbi:MAG: hypothetical protein ABIV26_05935, partial [Candidatus Limnocylindrales bacterium]
MGQPPSDLTEPGFVDRHIGPDPHDVDEMLRVVGHESLEALIRATVPAAIRRDEDLGLPPPRSEAEALADLTAMAAANTPL